MGQKDKLIKKLKANPKTFLFDEAEALLNYLEFSRVRPLCDLFQSHRYHLVR